MRRVYILVMLSLIYCGSVFSQYRSVKNIDYDNKRGENYFENSMTTNAVSKLIVVGAYHDYSGTVYIFRQTKVRDNNFGQTIHINSPLVSLNQVFGSDYIDNTSDLL
ncbi:MAG: hypothetical protein N4A72_01440 [Bacteroidales bacterium]|jgi:hypothetical protein|nr:hypothetical protein [Bacteroidales bacterium]